MCDGSICLILLSLSKIPCNQYIHANANPDRCRIHQSCNGKRQGNRRQSIFTQLRYKCAVYQIIGILQKHGNQRGIDICQMSFPTGATAILLFICILSLFSTNCPNNIVLFACCRLTGFLGRISPCFQYSVQSLGRDRFRFISPYTTARLDKRQKIFPHTDIVLHSANTSEIQATKKPHNYHKIAVWQKDDRIRKSPLKFCVYYYSEIEGDCQASIIAELCRRSVFFVLLYGT